MRPLFLVMMTTLVVSQQGSGLVVTVRGASFNAAPTPQSFWVPAQPQAFTSPQISSSSTLRTPQTIITPTPKPKSVKKTPTPQALPFASASGPTLPFASASGPASVIAAEANAYDQTKFRSFNMAITPQNLGLMNLDPKMERKVPTDFTSDYGTANAQTTSSLSVGCGYKGSVGSLRICFDTNRKFDPNSCRKPSYKCDATEFNPLSQDKILGLKRLLFHGAPADWSLMAERLSYNLLGQWGIAAPEATHAQLYENGKNLGVFVFVECVDDMFTQQHFGNDFNQGKGGLYKEQWFNPVHIPNSTAVSEAYKYGKNEDLFMNEIERVLLSTPLTQSAATAFFDKYFDTQSIVDVTAANTVLGNTDDWRQRHNFFWYVREDASGKKAVLIPWDYDRLNDEGADTRGALKGRPWWDPSTAVGCSSRIRPPPERGAISGAGDPAQAAYWSDIYSSYPPDVEVPVSCDRITQLMALALGTRIRQRTRELAASLNRQALQANLATWNKQIQAALLRDPDGPQLADMTNEQSKLLNAIFTAAQKAVTDANAGDRGVSSVPAPSSTSSNGPTFVPLSQVQQTGGDGSFFKYKPGQVISQTFTPVTPTVNFGGQSQSFLPPSFQSAPFSQQTAPFAAQPAFSPQFSQFPQASFVTPSFSTPSYPASSFQWGR